MIARSFAQAVLIVACYAISAFCWYRAGLNTLRPTERGSITCEADGSVRMKNIDIRAQGPTRWDELGIALHYVLCVEGTDI